MNNTPFLLLLFYSGFTLNLILQCGIGIKGVVESKKTFDLQSLVKSLIVLFSVIVLWFLFSGFLYTLMSGIYIYILVFPVSVLFYSGIEYLVFRYMIKKEKENDSIINFSEGITAISVFICINLADSVFNVIALSFGFLAGIFLINLIVWEVRRRAALEAVPAFLRGKPLILVTMGLLSLVFTTASLFLFRMIGAG
jgi:electron transport complex protein RnfA